MCPDLTVTACNIFRWYRAGWGQYTQPDPIGLRGGNNLYAYGDGSPSNFSDPKGLASVTTVRRHVERYPRRTQLPDVCNGQLSCTDFAKDFYKNSHLSCFCVGCDSTWYPRFTAVLSYDMYLSYEHPLPNDPDHEKHENLHVTDIASSLQDWLDGLEAIDHPTHEDYDQTCNETIGQFYGHVRSAAQESQRKRH